MRWLSPCLQVERGSPKSCFLYLGEVLCEVNWLSVLSDHLQVPPLSTPSPAPPHTPNESHTMLVYLLYMLVFLAKEEQMLSRKVRPHYGTVLLDPGFYPCFPFIHSLLVPFFPAEPPGLPSLQSFGPVHFSTLPPSGPVQLPGHSGLCQHPLSCVFVTLWWFCISAASEIAA